MANLADVNPSLLQNVANQLPQGQHRGLDQQELTRALIRQQQQQQQQQHGAKVSPATTVDWVTPLEQIMQTLNFVKLMPIYV